MALPSCRDSKQSAIISFLDQIENARSFRAIIDSHSTMVDLLHTRLLLDKPMQQLINCINELLDIAMDVAKNYILSPKMEQKECVSKIHEFRH